MAKLIFLLDGNVIKEYALDKERITIGRRASNDVHIDNLAVSGEHAEIVTTDQDIYVQDLNSTNGTLVNKQTIKKHVLQPGDTIGLGKYQLKFVQDMPGIMQPADGFADTVLVAPESSEEEAPPISEESAQAVEPDATEAQVESSSGPEGEVDEDKPAEETTSEQSSMQPEPEEPRLKILNGDNEGGALLLDKSMVKVGQPGEQVAVITKRQDGFFITHVAGDVYPIINGQAIGAQAYELNNHDEVEVLGIKMEFCAD